MVMDCSSLVSRRPLSTTRAGDITVPPLTQEAPSLLTHACLAFNEVRVGGETEMDEALEEAAQEAGIRWDKAKTWKGRQGKHLGVIMEDQRRHQRYRAQKAKAELEIL